MANSRNIAKHFDSFEEGPSGWDFVDNVTLHSMGWGTPKKRREMDVVSLCSKLERLRVGETHITPHDMRGRTKFTRTE